MKKIIIAILLTSFCLIELLASEASTQGSEFYFSFNRARPGREKNMTLTVSAGVAGYLIITDANGNFVNKPFTSGTTTINLAYANGSDAGEIVHLTGLTSCYQIASNTVDKRGYIVESFKNDSSKLDVSLYAGLSGSSTTDAANIYPIQALGNEYYVLSHLGFTQSGDVLASESVIVATEDNTTIEIIPTCLLDNQTPADEIKNITITLNRGETYQIRALDTRDITGTLIRTKDDGNLSGNKCKKIAVFSGNQHGYPGDYEYEQNFPTYLWGSEYLITAPENTGSNVVRILASKACTQVKINGAQVANLNQTDYFDYVLNQNEGCYIETDKPVSVAMYTANYIDRNYSSNDASMIVLAPVNQKLDSIMFTGISNPDASINKVTIVTPTEFVDSLSLYQLIGATWTPIPLSFWTTITANTDYSSQVASISATDTYKIISKKGGFNAYVYGYNGGAEYGYSAGSAAKPINANFYINGDPTLNSGNLNKNSCVDEAVSFTTTFPYEFSKVEWDFDYDSINFVADTVTTTANASHLYTTFGTYNVAMVLHKLSTDCYTIGNTDTVVGSFTISDYKKATRKEILCTGRGIKSTRTASFASTPNYLWSTGETTEGIAITDPAGTLNKKYWVKTWIACNVYVDTIYVDVITVATSVANSALAPNYTYCQGQTLTSPKTDIYGLPATYKWFDGSNNVIAGATSQTFTLPNTYGLNTVYVVEATNGCTFRDSFIVKIPAKLTNNIASSHSKVCGDGTTMITLVATVNGPAITNTWTKNSNPLTPSQSALIHKEIPTTTSTYQITSTGACETVQKDVTVGVNPPFTATLTADNEFLPPSGGDVTLDVTLNPSLPGIFNYVWSPSLSTTDSYTGPILSETDFVVTVTDINGLCSAVTNIVKISVGVIELPTIFTPHSPDGMNDMFGDKDIVDQDLKLSFVNGYTIQIFNRLGQLVAESQDQGWDGTYKNQVVDPGVYFYILLYKNAKGEILTYKKGTIEVVK